MVKKSLISISLSFLLMTGEAQATWKSWADGSISVQTSPATSYKGRGMGGMTLGGARIRWGNLGTVRPIHIDPPSFSVGCNGIDMFFGGLSYLDFDKLVEKLKLIASVAPAFAFKMAIQTVCSQCATIMQDIEDVINIINNMSLDACKIAQNLGTVAGKSIGDGINSWIDNGVKRDNIQAGIDAKDNPKSALRENWNNIKTFLEGTGTPSKVNAVTLNGSLLENIKDNVTITNGLDKDKFIEVIRGLVGDLYGTQDEDEKVTIFPYKIEPSDFIEGLLTGKQKVYGQKANITKDGDIVKSVKFTDVDLAYSESSNFYTATKAILDTFVEKTQSETLTSAEMNSMSGYTYLYVNIMARGDASGEINNIKEIYPKYLALKNIEASLSYILSQVSASIGEYTGQTSLPQRDQNKEAILTSYKDIIKSVQKEVEKTIKTIIVDTTGGKDINEIIFQTWKSYKTKKLQSGI